MQFDTFDIDTFLRDYWQRKPLLIRNPWNGWSNPLDPDELAGLACEEGVEARLIQQAQANWQVEHGPLPETRFATLDKQPWTMLVQAVDHHVPAVAALIEPFRFVPNWRIDDVMVSYATDGGGVGPHFDQYDVFLIQGLGRRRWQIGAACDESTPLLPHDDLRLLQSFKATEEWVLEPGDILYVPPRIAHNGIAIGDDCMTYSVGFRAPSRYELVTSFSDHVAEAIAEDDRYEDPGLARQANPGEISATALSRLQEMLAEALLDRDAFARWFGAYTTTPKYPETDWRPEEPLTADELQATIAQELPLCRNPASRFSFIRQTDGVLLFADGQTFECAGETAALAEAICAQDSTVLDREMDAASIDLLLLLCNQGSTGFDDED